jgi:hypothetical protein
MIVSSYTPAKAKWRQGLEVGTPPASHRGNASDRENDCLSGLQCCKERRNVRQKRLSPKIIELPSGIWRLKCLLHGERTSPTDISRQGLAGKSLPNS